MLVLDACRWNFIDSLNRIFKLDVLSQEVGMFKGSGVERSQEGGSILLTKLWLLL